MAGGLSVYVPIEGLTVSTPFPVGFITFRSAEDVLAQLDEPAPTNMRDDLRAARPGRQRHGLR